MATSIVAKRNSNIDLLRAFAALMIVTVHVLDHTAGAEYLAPFIVAARSWAVPFFFINSGYLFYQKYEGIHSRGVIKISLRLAILYGFAIFVYFLFDLRGFFSNGIAYFVKYMVTAQPNARHLWFLVALIFGYVSLFVFSRILGFLGLGILSLCLVLLGLVVEPYPYLFDAASPSNQRLLLLVYPHFLSIPFMFFGMVAARYDVSAFCRPGALLLMVVGGIGLGVIEAVIGARSGPVSHFYVGTYLSSVSLFLLALSSKAYTGSFFSFVARLGQKYSLLIYVYHLAIINALGLLVGGPILGGYLLPIALNAVIVFFGLIVFFAVFEMLFGRGIKLFSGEYFVMPIERLIFGK